MKSFRNNRVLQGLVVWLISLWVITAICSETPFGFWLQPIFDFERNYYDRIVHFSFCLLIAYPFREILMRQAGVKKQWSYFLAVTMIMAFSAFYEVMEAVVAMLVSPELGNACWEHRRMNGMHRKTRSSLFHGVIIAMLLTWIYPGENSRKKLNKQLKEFEQ
jgi:putative membrane protein